VLLTKEGVVLDGRIETVELYPDGSRVTRAAAFSLKQDPANPWRWAGLTSHYAGSDEDAEGVPHSAGGGDRREPFSVTFDADGGVQTESPSLPELQWSGRRRR
jgi:hypothetical protein